MLTYHRWSSLIINWDIHQSSITKIRLKIAHLKYHLNLLDTTSYQTEFSIAYTRHLAKRSSQHSRSIPTYSAFSYSVPPSFSSHPIKDGKRTTMVTLNKMALYIDIGRRDSHDSRFYLFWHEQVRKYRAVLIILKSLVSTKADPFQVLIILSNTTWNLKLSKKCPWWYYRLSHHANSDVYFGTMKTLGFQRFFLSFEHHWTEHTF